MKTKILLFGLIIATSYSASSYSFSCKDSAGFDSAFLNTFGSDFLLMMTTKKDSKSSSNVQSSVYNLSNEKYVSLKKMILHQRANIFSDAWDWVVEAAEAIARLWQPVWGKYTEPNSNTNPPLTTFNRNPDVYYNQRETIRANIKLADQ